MKMCEDFPACGHELLDCDGSLYGSDADIQAEVHDAWGDGHGYCDHAAGVFDCPDEEDDEVDDEPYEDYSLFRRIIHGE